MHDYILVYVGGAFCQVLHYDGLISCNLYMPITSSYNIGLYYLITYYFKSNRLLHLLRQLCFCNYPSIAIYQHLYYCSTLENFPVGQIVIATNIAFGTNIASTQSCNAGIQAFMASECMHIDDYLVPCTRL